MLPAIALVGRPNVGKSTLFNVLTRTRNALVFDRPGVTRDRQYGICHDQDRAFIVIDTGGISSEKNEFLPMTIAQTKTAMVESATILFMVDAKQGLVPDDYLILKTVRKLQKPFVLVVNKCDGLDQHALAAEFSRLGADETVMISATHKQGMEELMAAIAPRLPPPAPPPPPVEEEESDKREIKIALTGRPNVGKSTLVNRLLGEERVIASDTPGTTRDAIAVPLVREGKKYVLIDTAGVRRRARVEDDVEKFSVLKTLQAIEQANVVVVMLDSTEGVTEQDATLLGHVLRAGRALVIAINKWDGLDAYRRERCTVELDRRFAYVAYALRVFISAKHGSGIRELMKAIEQAYRSAHKRIASNDLTKALEIALRNFQPPLVRGHSPKLRYAHMGGHNPPRIIIHGSRLNAVAASYKRYLENFFRAHFRLEGTPIQLDFREGDNPFAGRKNKLTETQVRKRRRMIKHLKR